MVRTAEYSHALKNVGQNVSNIKFVNTIMTLLYEILLIENENDPEICYQTINYHIKRLEDYNVELHRFWGNKKLYILHQIVINCLLKFKRLTNLPFPRLFTLVSDSHCKFLFNFVLYIIRN